MAGTREGRLPRIYGWRRDHVPATSRCTGCNASGVAAGRLLSTRCGSHRRFHPRAVRRTRLGPVSGGGAPALLLRMDGTVCHHEEPPCFSRLLLRHRDSCHLRPHSRRKLSSEYAPTHLPISSHGLGVMRLGRWARKVASDHEKKNRKDPNANTFQEHAIDVHV